MEPKLYIGNLSNETNEDDLRGLFTQVGTVKDVVIVKDPETDSSMGFAYVTMNSHEEVKKAVYIFNKRRLDNRELKVSAVPLHASDSSERHHRPGQGDPQRS